MRVAGYILLLNMEADLTFNTRNDNCHHFMITGMFYFYQWSLRIIVNIASSIRPKKKRLLLLLTVKQSL